MNNRGSECVFFSKVNLGPNVCTTIVTLKGNSFLFSTGIKTMVIDFVTLLFLKCFLLLPLGNHFASLG